MSRFKTASKYRNSVLNIAKKEDWYSFPSSNSVQDPSLLKASTHLFGVRNAINSVALFCLSDSGKLEKPASVLSLGSAVSDFEFSPFGGRKERIGMAVGGEDGSIKIWSLSLSNLESSSESSSILLSAPSKIESLTFNPIAENILASSHGNTISIWDTSNNGSSSWTTATSAAVGDIAQQIVWKGDGSLLASSGKDNHVRIFDPRGKPEALSSGIVHNGVKPNRVTWIGTSDNIFTTGFNNRRDREYALWDVRDFSKPVSITKLDNSPGILNPLYDMDTGMMFLVGKGDTTVRFYEVDEKSVTQGVCQCNSPSTIASAALIPKTACKIMAGEVAKVLLMTSDGSNIIPVSIVVPRRTYIDFHADIFPDTKSDVEASLTSGQWLKGAAFPGFKLTSLDPSKTAKTSVGGDDSGGGSFNVAGAASTNSLTTAVSQLELFTSSQQQQQQQQPAAAASSTTTSSSSSKLFTPKTSSYRFVSGKSLAASRLDDLKFLSVAINGECDAIKANNLFVAFPIQGPGGRIAVWPAKKFGRLPSTKLPAVICGAEMTDFKFNPFVSDQLVTSSDDGKLRFWKIKSSADGLDKDLEEPVKSFTAHATRVTSFEFHPFALDILVTASPDTLKVWNVSSSQECLQTISITEQCLSMAFSPDGNTLIAALKDKTVSLFDVRTGATLQSGAASHEGIKACRLTWLSSHLVASVGFGKGSQREIRMYNSNDLSNCVSTTAIDTSPSLMETFFDEDTSLLFLAGRGETFISIFEIIDATATFLTRFDGSGGFVQQGFNFFPKLVCDVKQVEIAKCWRVVQNCVEQVSFTVPRLKKEFFQDDIFLPTNDRSKPLLTAADWVATSAVPAWPVVDRVPKDMIPLSKAPVEVKQNVKAVVLKREMTEAERKEHTIKSMIQFAQEQTVEDVLPQDKAQGCDDSEWD